ncbi:apoptosis-inducing factor 3-like [Diaphorina citri]|uniref:Apoptosis-inducing factor 3-like n=1 Tax=Diaphorina citri TaxID=121845 RepID=A0A3Q0J433_DIACI|nr:apoptosis-inducing factor 3-like [Diaphorina citri]
MTGDIEDFPALNPLPCYKVDVEDGMVYVSIQQRDLMYSSRYSRLIIPTPSYKTDETFVVIGGGPAAAICLEYLRRFGFTGRLLAFMKDAELPYDRTRLNDNLAVDVNTILLRNQEFYDQMRAEVFLSTSVVHMSAKDKTLVRSDGGVTSFDKVFIATGCEAKRLSQDVPGAMDAIGGDIAYAPLHPYFNTTTTGSHYQIAQVHGKTAASNMLGKPEPLKTIPFINVSLGEINLQYAGWIKNVDNVEIIGSLNEMKFAAYYMVGDKATGIVTCRLPGLASKFAESIHMEKYVQRHALHDHAWSQHLFTCDVHDRDMDYDLDLDKLREMGLVPFHIKHCSWWKLEEHHRDFIFENSINPPKRLSQDVPGAMDAIGMFYLRTPSDANAIYAALNEDLDLVVVGSSYLAMEMAVSCLPHVNSLTMISRSAYPFHKVFGQVLGRRLLNFYKDKGIIMRTSVKVVKVEMNPDTLAMTGIILSDDSIIRTQMVIVCVGDTFATRFLKGSGVEMTPEGAVPVDQYLTTNIPTEQNG